MAEKVLAFVTGHHRPTAAPEGAPFIRRFADGSLMLALSETDTIEAATKRHDTALARAASTTKKTGGAD